jgi:hypothetical protein
MPLTLGCGCGSSSKIVPPLQDLCLLFLAFPSIPLRSTLGYAVVALPGLSGSATGQVVPTRSIPEESQNPASLPQGDHGKSVTHHFPSKSSSLRVAIEAGDMNCPELLRLSLRRT